VAYDAADARSLAGRRTVEIEAILGYRGGTSDPWVIWREQRDYDLHG
jgi:hypothetical protein